MAKIVIEIGNKIELEHLRSVSHGSVSQTKYASQLLDYDGVRTAKILMPIVENRIVPLEIGDEYGLCFFTSSGLYQCTARIQDRYLDKKVNVLVVEFISHLKKFQRRKYYRLDCMFPIRHREVTDAEKILWLRIAKNDFVNDDDRRDFLHKLQEIPKEWLDATSSDLSGGGIRFRSLTQYKKNNLLEVIIPVSTPVGEVQVKLKLRVIASIHVVDSRLPFETRGEFIGIDDGIRENIIKFVFDEQRRRIRKD